MEEQKAQSLFAAVAANILAKYRGMKPTIAIQKEAAASEASFTKLAAEIPIPVNQLSPYNDFLSRYGYTPQDFVGDPEASAAINPQQANSKQQIREYFKTQAQMMGGMNADLAKNQELMLRDLATASGQARIRKSIGNTMATEAQSPGRFSTMKDLSDRSQAAFKADHTADWSTALSGIGGAVGGAAAGRSPLSRGLLAAAGGAGGALGGLLAGRKAEEVRTGYDHGDVLKPYELANRLQKRMTIDAKVK